MSLLLANALAPVFFVLALGYFAGRQKIVDNRNIVPLVHILMSFALPCALFSSMATTSRAALFAESSLIVALVAAMGLIYALTWFIQRRLRRMPPGEAAVQALTLSFPNCVAVGIPLLGSLFGAQGLVPVAIAIAIGATTISPLTLSVLEGESERAKGMTPGARFAQAVLGAFRKPVVWAPLLGLAFALVGLHLPSVTVRMLSLLGVATGGVALFLTGLIISSHPFKLGPDVLIGCFVKNIVQVLLMVAIVRLIHLPQPFAREAVILAALPAGFFGAVFSVSYGKQPTVASSTLAASTLFSVLTLAAVIYLTQAWQ